MSLRLFYFMSHFRSVFTCSLLVRLYVPCSPAPFLSGFFSVFLFLQSESMLTARREVVETKVKLARAKAAKLMAAGNKSSALNELKKSKLYEKELERLDGQISVLMTQVIQLESSQNTESTFAALKNAAVAGKKLASRTKVEDVEETMDQLNELQQDTQAINDALSFGAAAQLDDVDDLEAELEELGASALDEQLLQPAPVPAGAATAGRVPAKPAPQVPAQAQAARPVAPQKTAEELELEDFASSLQPAQ